MLQTSIDSLLETFLNSNEVSADSPEICLRDRWENILRGVPGATQKKLYEDHSGLFHTALNTWTGEQLFLTADLFSLRGFFFHVLNENTPSGLTQYSYEREASFRCVYALLTKIGNTKPWRRRDGKGETSKILTPKDTTPFNRLFTDDSLTIH